MRRIIAIGGGEIGRPGYPVETTGIDEQIVRATGKGRPKVLLVPTASGDSELYWETFKEHFGGRLECGTDVLWLLRHEPCDEHEAREKILRSDALYVGGGNTARMIRLWRRRGIDVVMREAWERGVVLSGLSAGAICWFRYGSSDSRKFANPDASLIRMRGLGLVNAALCPHYDVEESRKPDLKAMMLKTPGVAIALDNCSAIEIVGDWYRVLTCRAGAKAYRVYWSAGEYHEEPLADDGARRPLSALLQSLSTINYKL